MQFEIRAGGGRKGLEEAKTQIQIVQSANLILNPYLVVPITAPQTSVLAKGSKFKHISSVLQMFFVTDLFQAKAAVLGCGRALAAARHSWEGNLGKLLSNHKCNTEQLSHLSRQARKKKIDLGKCI